MLRHAQRTSIDHFQNDATNEMYRFYDSSSTSKYRLFFGLFLCVSCVLSGYFIGIQYCGNIGDRLVTTWGDFTTELSPSMTNFPNFEGFNGTHLWSLRLADEKYYRLARLLPCRTVNYTKASRIDPLNSCDYSADNEFSVENTLKAQKWIFEHQNPSNCKGKRFAIITNYAWSGYGSVIHQLVWAFGMALAEDRIAVYQTPGNWLYTDCPLGTLDCVFLPISNCSVPAKDPKNQTIEIKANFGYWKDPIHPPIFQNRSFNWYRSQLVFYLMRFKPETLTQIQKVMSKTFKPPMIDVYRPYVALYARRSDKIQFGEMKQVFSLENYFKLFHYDAMIANIHKIYVNSEDESVFVELNKLKQTIAKEYDILTINVTRNIVFRSLDRYPRSQIAQFGMEFLVDLFIEVNADLHVGTLTSNWCRLVDEFRLVLGKYIPFYTPENQYLSDW